MAIRVRDFIDRVRNVLQETSTDGVRWSNPELVGYLNEAYQFILTLAPEASTDNSEFSCAAGAKQSVPVNAIRLIDVVGNLEGSMLPVQQVDRSDMDKMRPGWRGEAGSKSQEKFMYDERDPRTFYVYPPALVGSLLEIVTVVEIDKHDVDTDYEDTAVFFLLNDRYIIPAQEYILYCCYRKDAEDGGNFALSQAYMKNAYNALGIKIQNDIRVSPNNPANKQ